MKTFVPVVLFAAVGFALPSPQASTDCPVGSKWVECGTACPPTCEEPNPEICTTQCVTGCQCLQGLLLNAVGSCVPPSQCPGGAPPKE